MRIVHDMLNELFDTDAERYSFHIPHQRRIL